MRPLKILFQEPLIPREVSYGKFEAGAGNNTFPYGIASICQYIAGHGIQAEYLEPSIERMTPERYLEYIRAGGYDLVGIGAATIQVDYVMETFRLLKEHFPHIVTVLGGIHGTLLPLETIGASATLDFLVAGEGEKPFLQLVECLGRGDREGLRTIPGLAYREGAELRFNPPDAAGFLPPDQIPIPRFDLFPMRKYVAQITFAKTFPSYSVIASRGCPYRCAFCNACDVMGRRVRWRSMPSLLEEIRILKEEYGARGIMFLDSTFTLNRRWVQDFCAAYRRSGLKLPWACNSRADTVDCDLMARMQDAGCWELVFGIESANQKSLDLIRKGTTVAQNEAAMRSAMDLGLYVYGSYILCLPGETEEDALRTIRFAGGLAHHMALFYLPVPYPKTELWDICLKTGGLRENRRWADFNTWDYHDPVYVNPLIGKEKMWELYKKAYLEFYSNPRVLFRILREFALLRQHPRKLWLGARAFSALAFTRVGRHA